MSNPPRALLLDLSGDTTAAVQWARSRVSQHRIELLNKADLKWESKRNALANVRSRRPSVFILFTSDLRIQSSRRSMILFAIASGAKQVLFGDACGRVISRSRSSGLAIDAPLLCCEFAAAYLGILPLSWLLTVALAVVAKTGRDRSTFPASRHAPPDRLRALYVRGTLLPEARESAGGAAAHAQGFVTAAASLGLKMEFIVSSTSGIQDGRPGRVTLIPPSPAIAPNRALFELYNNLLFTARAILLLRNAARTRFDFIYSRYSRFNWTAVVLSVITGLPLILEFNGSEVWVSEHWDPVGLIPLLKRFERVNVDSAALIAVVSSAQHDSLIKTGVEPSRIVINPNGVDLDRFRPNCGGIEFRRELGLADKVVVGFLGTFGPWHGASVLAQAAARIGDDPRLHFLFIGDGDERPTAEAIINASSAHATFVGRASPSDVPSYLDACDILVSPQISMPDASEFFGSPTKLFEYMATSKAIVASRMGQIGEAIVDQKCGLLVDPGDPQALADAIVVLAGDRCMRERFGSSARARVERCYTWRHNAERIVSAAKLLISHNIDVAVEGALQPPGADPR